MNVRTAPTIRSSAATSIWLEVLDHVAIIVTDLCEPPLDFCEVLRGVLDNELNDPRALDMSFSVENSQLEHEMIKSTTQIVNYVPDHDSDTLKEGP